MSKKYFGIFMCVILMIFMTACGKSEENTPDTPQNVQTEEVQTSSEQEKDTVSGTETSGQQESTGTEQAGTEQTGAEQNETEQTGAEQNETEQTGAEQAGTEQNETEQTGAEQAETERTDTEKTAVVYFSATGTTAEVAKLIADETDADIFEIVPQEVYTSEDLNYNDDNCRANLEMNDDTARPAINGDLSKVSDYDRIYLGYPIWWGTAPRIIQTFLESYDLSGAKIYTFCTSGGSGVEQSVKDLQEMYTEMDIVSGKRLNGATESDVTAWIEGLD